MLYPKNPKAVRKFKTKKKKRKKNVKKTGYQF